MKNVSRNSKTSPFRTSTTSTITKSSGSGINGTGVHDFTFNYGRIDDSGDAVGESNIAFNGNGSLTGNNIDSTPFVGFSILTNAFDVGNAAGAKNPGTTNGTSGDGT